MQAVQWTAADKGVPRVPMVEADLDPPAPEDDAKRQPLDAGRQARGKAQRLAVVAHAAKAGDGSVPRPGQRAHVYAFAHVVLEVLEIHQRGFSQEFVASRQVATPGTVPLLG